jgi:hypothetical protein
VRIIAQGQFDVNQENTEGFVLVLNSLDRFVAGSCRRKPVYLVCLVYLVCSVCLVCSVEQDQLVELSPAYPIDCQNGDSILNPQYEPPWFPLYSGERTHATA